MKRMWERSALLVEYIDQFIPYTRVNLWGVDQGVEWTYTVGEEYSTVLKGKGNEN